MARLETLTPQQSAQLRLQLEIPEPVDGPLSPEEAELISQAAREAFEASGKPEKAEWVRAYADLRSEGWPWRVAAYIAWAASPKADRWPATQEKLATEILGLTSDRVIREWRAKNPAIDAAVGLLQSKQLFEHRGDILQALIASASAPDYKHHADRKLALQMLGDHVDRVEATVTGKPKDLSELSDAELAAIEAAAREQAK